MALPPTTELILKAAVPADEEDDDFYLAVFFSFSLSFSLLPGSEAGTDGDKPLPTSCLFGTSAPTFLMGFDSGPAVDGAEWTAAVVAILVVAAVESPKSYLALVGGCSLID